MSTYVVEEEVVVGQKVVVVGQKVVVVDQKVVVEGQKVVVVDQKVVVVDQKVVVEDQREVVEDQREVVEGPHVGMFGLSGRLGNQGGGILSLLLLLGNLTVHLGSLIINKGIGTNIL